MAPPSRSLESSFDRYIDAQPTTYNCWERIKYFPITLVTAPIKFVAGLAQTIVFAILTPLRGYFYKTGIKGYFIDNFLLMKDDFNEELREKYKREVQNGTFKNLSIRPLFLQGRKENGLSMPLE